MSDSSDDMDIGYWDEEDEVDVYELIEKLQLNIKTLESRIRRLEKFLVLSTPQPTQKERET